MISVLTVAYNNAVDIRRLAQSIVASHGTADVELIITNNQPGTPVSVADELAALTRIICRPNIGYGRAINAAARHARGDTLFIANADVRLGDGVLRAAAAYLRDHADIRVLLPRLQNEDGTLQSSARRFYTWPVALYARAPGRDRRALPRFFSHYLMEGITRHAPADVDWGLGGALFLRRADYPGGQIFDPRFFLYFEDVDLCLRAWSAGMRVVYHPGLICTHAHRRQSKRVASRQGWHHLRSFVRFVLKHGGLPRRPFRMPRRPRPPGQ